MAAVDKRRTAVHITDVRSFKDCRQRWDFSSPLRMNLEPIHPDKNLLTGSLVHEALAEAYAEGSLNGELLVSSYERAAQEQEHKLRHASFGEELTEKVLSELWLGLEVLKHYVLWADRFDADRTQQHPRLAIAEVFETEIRLEIPLPIVPGVYLYYEGTADGLVRTRAGDYALLEHKTCARFPETDTLYLDEQMFGYLWASNAVDYLPHKPSGVLYNFLRKSAPTTPKRLVDGSFSRNKSVRTSFDYYKFIVESHGQNPTDYKDILHHLYQADDNFFRRVFITKKPRALAAFSRRLYDTITDMVDPSVRIYPSPAWYRCNWCPFLEPCRFLQDGINPSPILRTAYQKREPRWADISLEES